MYPNLHVGHLHLSSYVVAHVLGVAAGVVLGYRELRRIGLSQTRAAGALLVLALAAHVGAHAYHVASYWDAYRGDRDALLDFFTGGLALHGGILGGMLGLLALSGWWRIDRWAFGDALAPAGALGLAIFRLGCWAKGCCWGRPAGEDFVLAGLSTKLVQNRMVSLHPTQLYCAAFALLLFGLVWARRRRKLFEGELVLLGVLLYPTWRFAVEFLRDDTPKDIRVLGLALDANQPPALALLALGLVVAWLRRPALEAGVAARRGSRGGDTPRGVSPISSAT
jgi:phosphatidylglycerol:prolipoprotein diacylglycerol transferase